MNTAAALTVSTANPRYFTPTSGPTGERLPWPAPIASLS